MKLFDALIRLINQSQAKQKNNTLEYVEEKFERRLSEEIAGLKVELSKEIAAVKIELARRLTEEKRNSRSKNRSCGPHIGHSRRFDQMDVYFLDWTDRRIAGNFLAVFK